MEIIYQKEAYKDIRKLVKSNKQILRHIISSIEKLAKGEYKNLDIKMIKNHNNLFRLRVGTYRILYKIDTNNVIIYVVKTRQEVYEWLKNN